MATAIACRTYDEIIGVIALRRRELGLQQLDVDGLTGLADGYHGKTECKDRRLGTTSAPAVFNALAVSFHEVVHSV
jgi:hypothetical protein